MSDNTPSSGPSGRLHSACIDQSSGPERFQLQSFRRFVVKRYSRLSCGNAITVKKKCEHRVTVMMIPQSLFRTRSLTSTTDKIYCFILWMLVKQYQRSNKLMDMIGSNMSNFFRFVSRPNAENIHKKLTVYKHYAGDSLK